MGAGSEDAVQNDRNKVSLGSAQKEMWEGKVSTWKQAFSSQQAFPLQKCSNIIL